MTDSAPATAPTAQATRSNPSGQGPDAIEVQTRIELVKMAFRQLRTGALVSAAGTLGLTLLVWNHTSLGILLGWIALMGMPISWLFWLATRYERLPPGAGESRHWALWLITGTTASAAGWGLTPWLFPFLTQPGVAGVSHALLLAGLATASVRVLLPMRKGSVAYVSAMMGPFALCYLSRGDSAGLMLVAFAGLFVAYTVGTTLHSHHSLSHAIASRFKLEALADELRAEIQRRESRETELQEARVRAESASKAKGDFLATISHEIRTPMNGVLGMLRIVRDTELTPNQIGYIKTATDSAEALLLLLNDVLDFSKIEANRLELEHAPFAPTAAARNVADLNHTRARDKGLQFDLRVSDDLPVAIVGDSARVRQILGHLVSNAIKFTERGRVELKVDCLERTPQRATLQFTVSDTGPGIDSATLARLFKPFTQADNSLSRRYGGSGLGLAIAMRLSQSMGGTLQVQSVVGQGSTFRFTLPCPLPEGTLPPVRSDGAPRFVPPRLSGRVLVVEDDLVNQQVIELFLKKLNVSLKFAGDGESGVAAATSETFDLVLMDCQLPGIDGMEATRRIRQKLAGKPLKIVALTANASAHIREACLASGMNEFLSKPVRFEQLANMLQRHLPSG